MPPKAPILPIPINRYSIHHYTVDTLFLVVLSSFFSEIMLLTFGLK